MGPGPGAWDGHEGEKGSCLIFQDCHLTPVVQCLALCPRGAGQQEGPALGAFRSFWRWPALGSSPRARPAAGRAESSPHPSPQVFIEVILGIFFLSSRHIPGILSQPFQLGSWESAGGCRSLLVPRASCSGPGAAGRSPGGATSEAAPFAPPGRWHAQQGRPTFLPSGFSSQVSASTCPTGPGTRWLSGLSTRPTHRHVHLGSRAALKPQTGPTSLLGEGAPILPDPTQCPADDPSELPQALLGRRPC